MNDTSIEIGDTVTFAFADGGQISGEVTYMPQASGDCWHLKVPKGAWANPRVIYVQQFETVTKEVRP